jgi:hypothetical protein
VTGPRGELPGGGRVRVITLGGRGRLVLALLLLVGGAVALVVGTTLLLTLLAVGVVAGAVGALGMGIRRLMRGDAPPDADAGRVPRGPLDPSMEVFPDRPARGTLQEGDDERRD